MSNLHKKFTVWTEDKAGLVLNVGSITCHDLMCYNIDKPKGNKGYVIDLLSRINGEVVRVLSRMHYNISDINQIDLGIAQCYIESLTEDEEGAQQLIKDDGLHMAKYEIEFEVRVEER